MVLEKVNYLSTKERRQAVKQELIKSSAPIKGVELAKMFGVSRQVIVQDMAILKAEGFQVIATPNGYISISSDNSGIIKRIAVKHKLDSLKKELEIFLNNDAKVIDVSVEHPIYGEIKGNLNIGTISEMERFLSNINEKTVEPLSNLTDGIHVHTIEVRREEDYENIMKKLREENLLAD